MSALPGGWWTVFLGVTTLLDNPGIVLYLVTQAVSLSALGLQTAGRKGPRAALPATQGGGGNKVFSLLLALSCMAYSTNGEV